MLIDIHTQVFDIFINKSEWQTGSCYDRYLILNKSKLPALVILDYARLCSKENVLDPTSSDPCKVEELLRC